MQDRYILVDSRLAGPEVPAVHIYDREEKKSVQHLVGTGAGTIGREVVETMNIAHDAARDFQAQPDKRDKGWFS